MYILDLFAGIGSASLSAHQFGWQTSAFVEMDKKCHTRLKKNFGEDILIYEDVRKFNGQEFTDSADIVCAGFPCPKFSFAGKRTGFKEDQLFFEVIRIAQECSSRWLILENVEGVKRWLPEIRAEIQRIGYEFTDAVFDGRDFGIPQMRRRYFAVCFHRGNVLSPQSIRRIQGNEDQSIYGSQPDTENTERWWTSTVKTKDEWRIIGTNARRSRANSRSADWMDRMRMVGNSFPPQMITPIFNAINSYEISNLEDKTTNEQN